MRLSIRRALALLATATPLAAQQPAHEGYAAAFEGRRPANAPQVRYLVRVNANAPAGYDVAMTVRGAPDTVRIAFPIWAPGAYRVANFARNIQGVTMRAAGRALPVVREDSATWRAVAPGGGDVTITYQMRFPSAAAAATPNNRSFMTATGGLVDGPQAYAYLPGHKDVPAHVRFELPRGWRIATGLVPTSDSAVFFAPSYDVLIDSPVMVGRFARWRFDVEGVPHRVAFWLAPGAPAFDTTTFLSTVKRGVAAAAGMMGDIPYREYTFLYVDGVGGGLEHLNSTTIGVSAARLAQDPRAAVGVTVHEFFHLWNVKRLRPEALGPFDYQHEVRSRELWWSEGVTDYFAAELSRRAGLLTEAEALAELEGDVQAYVQNPAVGRLSPERTSETAWDTPAVNEGFSLSYYLQGRLIGEMLELRLREATDFQRGMDDLMRVMYARHAGERGFTGAELAAAAAEVCGCDLSTFWTRYIREGAPLDFDAGLGTMGYQMLVRRVGAMTDDGRAAADLRLGILTPAGYGSAGGAAGGRLRLSVGDPTSVWGRAGLLTGDELVALAGRPVASTAEFRRVLAGARIGDTVVVEVLRRGVPVSVRVPVMGYERVLVRIVELPQVTPRMRQMRRVWMTGRP
jgi:predicted metalloprotease with PDZ domain